MQPTKKNKQIRPLPSFLLNAVAFFVLGVLFVMPWLFTNEEIAANVESFVKEVLK